jgi:hypothetical protein
MAGASLRIIDLVVFRRFFLQLLMGAGSNDLTFHQKNDLFEIPYGGYLLGNRYEGQAGIVSFEVAKYGIFGLIVHP